MLLLFLLARRGFTVRRRTVAGSERQLEVRILGPFEVVADGGPVAAGGRKQREVLAVLATRAGTAVSTDTLIDALWPEGSPPTAQATVQVYVSRLRKLLGSDAIVSEGGGYRLALDGYGLDAARFERLSAAAGESRRAGRLDDAEQAIGAALSLWRGAALVDFAYEPWAQPEIIRLEERRLACVEERFDLELAFGRHSEIAAELPSLVQEHPLRERLRGQLMLALYRSGRQGEALAAYQDARTTLVEELGIEPSRELQSLNRQILNQSEELAPNTPSQGFGAVRQEARDLEPPGQLKEPRPAKGPQRAVLVLSDGREVFADALAIAQELVLGEEPHELVLAQLLDPAEGGRLPDVAASLAERRHELEARGGTVRVSVFTSAAYAEDVLRLASRSEIDLLLTHGSDGILRDGAIDDTLTSLLRQVLCDVAFLVGGKPDGSSGREGPVVVPFGAGEHDWAALELGAWLARAGGRPLHLLGTVAESESGMRDASRLLADAGLLIQRASGVAPVPRLVAPGHEGVVQGAAEGGLLVIGLSERWGEEGLGMTRWAIARSVPRPVLFVRRGLRPGGITPEVSATRFAWSMTAGA